MAGGDIEPNFAQLHPDRECPWSKPRPAVPGEIEKHEDAIAGRAEAPPHLGGQWSDCLQETQIASL